MGSCNLARKMGSSGASIRVRKIRSVSWLIALALQPLPVGKKVTMSSSGGITR
ncbi:hypothetical protein D3C86_1359980 [compost metagenome]